MDQKLRCICYDCLEKAHMTDYGIIDKCEICGETKSVIKVANEIFKTMRNNIINETLRRR